MQADCDDVAALKAILSGLKAMHEKTGDIPLLIHTVSLPLCLKKTATTHRTYLASPERA